MLLRQPDRRRTPGSRRWSEKADEFAARCTVGTVTALICLDVDGTLLCRIGTDLHHRAFLNAACAFGAERTTLGDQAVPLRHIDTRGRLDGQIARDVLDRCRLDTVALREFCRAVEREYLGLCQEAAETDVITLPGVRHTLESLRRRGHTLAVVSGNLPAIGAKKLERAGLAEFIDSAHWGSPGVTSRAELITAAVRAHPQASEVCYVGDTVRDQEAATAARVRFLAVGTGGNDRSVFSGGNWAVGLGCGDAWAHLPW